VPACVCGCGLAQILRSLEFEYLKANGRRNMLHGARVKAGLVVWAKEMQYLHVVVDESGDYWAGFMKNNEDEDDRAFIPHRFVLMPGGRMPPGSESTSTPMWTTST